MPSRFDLDALIARTAPQPQGQVSVTPAELVQTGRVNLDAILAQVSQRWRDRRTSFRLREDLFDPSRFGVEVIEEAAAKDFVVRHHYSASYPAARLRIGLFEKRPFLGPRLAGVAVFSVPMHESVIPKYAEGMSPRAGVELGRLMLLDDLAFNAETWFLSRAFQALRGELDEVQMVLSYSDPVPRQTEEGKLIMPGHVGQIYQAFNGRFVGRSSARWLWLDRAGRVVSARALSKIRNEERGAAYAADQLLKAGAPRPKLGESGRDWVERSLREGPFRRVYHPGNYAYVWAVGGPSAVRVVQRTFAPPLPYPRKSETP